MRAAVCMFLALAIAAPAFAETTKAEPAAPIYKVVKEDPSIFAADRRVSDYYQGEDGSLILRVGVGDWYRVEVWQPCKSDLRWENRIALNSNPTGSFDKFSRVIVDGNTCAVSRIDKIEDPRPIDKALREKAKAKEKSAS
jgi:hypothetical protein